ncbi:hypothetical protein [Modestobacter versicolor]|uniref:hypothetical protein n=1 Tax=Modestobacter versicolor TaxID=429133 RepID=UPI0034DF7FAB
MTIPLRPGAGRAPGPAARPTGPDPLAPLLELPGVAAAAEDARAAVDRLLGHKVLRRESAGVSAESALRGARASATLEGVDVPLAELRAGGVTDPVVQGSLRVSVGLGAMVETWERAPGQVLARLHVLAATDLADPADLGRPTGQAGPRLSGLFSVITGASSARRSARSRRGRNRRRCSRTSTATGCPSTVDRAATLSRTGAVTDPPLLLAAATARTAV